MNSRRRWNLVGKSVVTSFLVGVALFGAWATRRHLAREGWFGDAPLRNYGVVWESKLTRSGMPYVDGGWTWLRDRGVKSVVTFREENDVDYPKYGFTDVLHLGWNGYKVPTDQQAEEFLEFIQDPKKQPVHIHCSAGRSRTGTMAALARYSIDGWPMEKALAEARQYRDGKDLSQHLVVWLKQWAAKHPPGSYRLHEPATVAP